MLYGFCKEFLDRQWSGHGVYQVLVGSPKPTPITGQQDLLLGASHPRRQKLLETIDRINSRYGEFAVMPMPLLKRSDMPDVISPAWKPSGHRETIAA